MGRSIALLYGVVAYLVFFASFLWAIAFVGNVYVAKSIDVGGPSEAFGKALLINVVLLGLFAAQHNIMARPGFKKKWTKIVPESVERSTYVLVASLLLLLLFWQWRPMPDVVWSVGGIGATVLIALFWVGWVTVLASTVLINHFELFGLRQVFLNFKQQEHTHTGFRTPLLYKLVRHPLMLGFIIAFWAAPTMTQGHLAFAVITTVWILGTIRLLEEPDLVDIFGDTYRQYQNDVNMIIPIPKFGGGGAVAAAPAAVAAAPEPLAPAPEPMVAPDRMDEPSVPEPGGMLPAEDEDEGPGPAVDA